MLLKFPSNKYSSIVNNYQFQSKQFIVFLLKNKLQSTVFEATLDDGRKIQAQIKEKKTAQRKYCHALRKRHGAFLLEQNEKSNDVFTISVGKSLLLVIILILSK